MARLARPFLASQFLRPLPRQLNRRDLAVAVTLIFLGVALPAALAVSFHSFDIPRNDDWAYRRVLWHFVNTGHLSLVGWGTMTLVGQILWTAPFAVILGAHAWVPGVAVACASTIGLISAYALARALLPRTWATGCVVLALSLPGFLLNTTSFMTDVPAFSADMACLALGVLALRKFGSRRAVLLAASLAVGWFGFTIREFDIAAPLAVLIATWAQDPRRWRIYAAIMVSLLAISGATYSWTTHLPGSQHQALGGSSLPELAALYFTLSFCLVPVLPLACAQFWRRASRPDIVLGLTIVGLGTWLVGSNRAIFLGNYLIPQGATGDAVLSGTRPALFPSPVWQTLEAVAILAGGALALVLGVMGPSLVRTIRTGTPQTMMLTFALLSAAILLFFWLVVQGDIFDRYLWPLVFTSAIIIVARSIDQPMSVNRTSRPNTLVARMTFLSLMTVVLLVAGAVTVNADSYDSARWRAGELAVEYKIAPAEVDAGFEWVGTHATGIATAGRQRVGAAPYETGYDQMFASFRDCAVVSNSPWRTAGLIPLAKTTYNELGVAVRESLYVYVAQRAQCSP